MDVLEVIIIGVIIAVYSIFALCVAFGLLFLLFRTIKKVATRNVYDKDGYDKRGYGRDGYNKEGYNRIGQNRYGYDKNGNYVAHCDNCRLRVRNECTQVRSKLCEDYVAVPSGHVGGPAYGDATAFRFGEHR